MRPDDISLLNKHRPLRLKRHLHGVRMKFIVNNEPAPLGSPDALTDATLPGAEPAGYDLLVEVHSISVNKVGTKIRGGMLPPPVVPGAGQACVRGGARRLPGIEMLRFARKRLTQAHGTVAEHFYSIIT